MGIKNFVFRGPLEKVQVCKVLARGLAFAPGQVLAPCRTCWRVAWRRWLPATIVITASTIATSAAIGSRRCGWWLGWASQRSAMYRGRSSPGPWTGLGSTTRLSTQGLEAAMGRYRLSTVRSNSAVHGPHHLRLAAVEPLYLGTTCSWN